VTTTISQDLHKIRKAPLLPFFSKCSILDLEPFVVEKIEKLCQGIQSFLQREEALIAGRAFTALMLDVITDYYFQNSWNCLENEEFSPEWRTTMTRLFEPVPVTKQFPWIIALMSSLPKNVMARLSPDMARYLGAKDVSQLQQKGPSYNSRLKRPRPSTNKFLRSSEPIKRVLGRKHTLRRLYFIRYLKALCRSPTKLLIVWLMKVLSSLSLVLR
jgi:hypothetical protein